MRRPHGQFLWLLIFLNAVLLLTAGGRIAPQDEETVFRMTAALIERGEVTISSEMMVQDAQTFPGFLPPVRDEILTTWAGPGVDGRIYPLYPHGQPLLQAPLYLMGRVLGDWQSTLVGLLPARVMVAMLNPIVIGLTGWLITLFGSQLGFGHRLSVGLGLTYGLGTMALAYTHTHFGEPLLALFYLAAAYTSFRARKAAERQSRRWLILAGVMLGVSMVIRVRAMIVIPFFLIYIFFTQSRRRSALLAVLIPIGIAAIWIAVWNTYRFGSPFQTGDGLIVKNTGFNTPLLFGLYGLLLSPGKSLFLYNPIALPGVIGLIAMFRQHRTEAALFSAIGVVLLVSYALYDIWSGGWNWGPRYLLTTLPFLVLSAGVWVQARASKLARAALAFTAVLGLLVNLPAALVDHSRYLIASSEVDPQHYLERTLTQFDRSPVIQQWPTVVEMAAMYGRAETWTAAHDEAAALLHAEPVGADFASLSTQLLKIDEFFRLNVPDFWFVHLLLLGLPPVPIVLLTLVLLAVTVLSGVRLIKELRATRDATNSATG